MCFLRVLLLAFFLNASAFAGSYAAGTVQLTLSWPKELVRKAIPIGTAGTIEHESLNGPSPVIFLGRYLSQDQKTNTIGIFQTDTNEVHYLSPDKTNIFDQDHQPIRLSRLLSFAQPLMQQGATCASYSLYNYLRQISLRKNSPLALQNQFVSDKNREQMIEHTKFEMYEDANHGLVNALKDLGSEYGLRYLELPKKNSSVLSTAVLNELKKGWSVILRFNVPSEMFHQEDINLWDDQGDFPQISYNHLWLPSNENISFSKSEAHAIVALGAFKVGVQSYIVVADPNFGLPRIWKAEYLNGSSSAKLRAFVLWFKQPQLLLSL